MVCRRLISTTDYRAVASINSSPGGSSLYSFSDSILALGVDFGRLCRHTKNLPVTSIFILVCTPFIGPFSSVLLCFTSCFTQCSIPVVSLFLLTLFAFHSSILPLSLSFYCLSLLIYCLCNLLLLHNCAVGFVPHTFTSITPAGVWIYNPLDKRLWTLYYCATFEAPNTSSCT